MILISQDDHLGEPDLIKLILKEWLGPTFSPSVASFEEVSYNFVRRPHGSSVGYKDPYSDLQPQRVGNWQFLADM